MTVVIMVTTIDYWNKSIMIAFVYHPMPNRNLNSIYIENMKHATGGQLSHDKKSLLLWSFVQKRDTLGRYWYSLSSKSTGSSERQLS